MHLVDLHVPTSRRSLELNPDLRSLAATQAKHTAASDLRDCATGAGFHVRSLRRTFDLYLEQSYPFSDS